VVASKPNAALVKPVKGSDKRNKISIYFHFDILKQTNLALKEGGKKTKKPKGNAKGQFPWHAVVLADEKTCGGSLLDDEWVLTSASCVIK
jgi:hypothetical protein